MPDTERTKEVVEKDLQDTREKLNTLIQEVNNRGYQEEGDEETIKQLEEDEKKFQKELESLKGGVSSGSNEKNKEKEEFQEMSKDEALEYLDTIKDYKWSQLAPLGRKWIGAVQVVLKDKGYSVGKIDGYLGRRTKRGIKKFQKEHGLRPDGKPGTKTINAILGNSVEKGKGGTTGDKTSETQGETTKTYDDGSTFTGTFDKDGNLLTGTYRKDGYEVKYKDGKKVE